MIDLRSDTISLPTLAMRRAMSEAVVGDDVYGEDPTVNRLQELSAEITGKEDALYVPSGTMGNQVCLLTHTSPGTEVILEADSHIFYYEAGAASAFAGVQTRPLSGVRGRLSADMVEQAIRPDDIHLPPTSLVCLENTHNRAGGLIMPLGSMQDIYRVAKKHDLPVHLDGARIFNASVATGIPVKDFAACATSIQFCFSKGLGAPVGSIVAGTGDFIAEARRWRKRLGGGMRQAGIVAAACLVALDTMVERLAEDHHHARILAEGLAGFEGLEINPNDVETNIVMVKPTAMSAAEFCSELKKRGVLTGVMEPDRVRLTTNKEVDSLAIDRALVEIKQLLSGF